MWRRSFLVELAWYALYGTILTVTHAWGNTPSAGNAAGFDGGGSVLPDRMGTRLASWIAPWSQARIGADTRHWLAAIETAAGQLPQPRSCGQAVWTTRTSHWALWVMLLGTLPRMRRSGADDPSGGFGGQVNGMCVNYSVADAAAASVFDALSEGGQIQMPLGQTFFSPAFGMCTDRFGTPWMVMAEAPAAS